MISLLPSLCTIQRRYQQQKLSYSAGTSSFSEGATVTGGVSGATATIVKVVGNTVSGYLRLNNVVGTFQSGETITDSGTGSATTSSTASNFQNDTGELVYYWIDEYTNVNCRIYTNAGSLVVLAPGQYPQQISKIILDADYSLNSKDFRVVSTVSGFEATFAIKNVYTPYAGEYGPHHIELKVQEIAQS